MPRENLHRLSFENLIPCSPHQEMEDGIIAWGRITASISSLWNRRPKWQLIYASSGHWVYVQRLRIIRQIFLFKSNLHLCSSFCIFSVLCVFYMMLSYNGWGNRIIVTSELRKQKKLKGLAKNGMSLEASLGLLISSQQAFLSTRLPSKVRNEHCQSRGDDIFLKSDSSM